MICKLLNEYPILLRGIIEMIQLEVVDTNKNIFKLDFQKVVDKCPFCKKGIEPIILNTYINCQIGEIGYNTKARVIYKCPIINCRNIFISVHNFYGHGRRDGSFLEPDYVYPILPDEISPTFGQIYNQASFAEQHNLLLIAGPGYRKALEFLIKDYAKRISDEDDCEKIENNFLGSVIKDYIDDVRIKDMAKRAAWLGNDETHYLRRWDDKDLESLKLLIELTTRWIESVELSRKFKEDMPEK